jgi:uncharacterized membrane protein
MHQTEQRIDRLERLVADLDVRIAFLERPGREPVERLGREPAPEPKAHDPQAALAERAAIGTAPAPPAPPRPMPTQPAPAPTSPLRHPAPPRSTIFQFDFGREDLEDLVGGRVLAWVGGLAVLLGIVFLFALAVSNGWIGETARVVLGAVGSGGLLALGV